MRILVRTTTRIGMTMFLPVFLPEITSTVVQRDVNKLFNMAYEADTIITRQGRESLVIMSKARYAELIKLTKES